MNLEGSDDVAQETSHSLSHMAPNRHINIVQNTTFTADQQNMDECCIETVAVMSV